MKELIDKLSSYNIFNYLLPGILFVILTRAFTTYNLVLENLILGPFFYYFVGMAINGFGAIVIEPILKGIKFITFGNYNDYVEAVKQDPKLELLSEINNTFRNMIAMIVMLVLTCLYNYFQIKLYLSDQISMYAIIIFLLIIFLLSYRKQTNYITKHISIYKTLK